jgi:hypothetical protein
MGKRDVAQLGSAARSGRVGRRFKSYHPDLFPRPHFSYGGKFLLLSHSQIGSVSLTQRARGVILGIG